MRTTLATDKPLPAPAAEGSSEYTALAWMERSASRLGLPPIPGMVVDDLREALPFPLYDTRYARNTLVPGLAPLEVSFAEAEPGVLRLDFEPYGPGGFPPAIQRQRAATMAGRWVMTCFPPAIAREYERCLDALCRQPLGPPPTFGAFLGLTFDDQGLAEVKIYLGWSAGLPDGLPARLAATARTALATVPGLTPHFASLSCGRRRCIPRLYFLCREELPLLALRGVLDAAGLTHRLAELACLILPLAGGSSVLPADCLVLSFREYAGAIDCKFELLTRALPVSPPAFAREVQRSLAQRPATRAAFQHWWHAVGGDSLWPAEINVAGFRVSLGAPAQFAAYLSPPPCFGPCPK